MAHLMARLFLSTLSLRRATLLFSRHASESRYFYPRSPCGERRFCPTLEGHKTQISIHALLAESDSTTLTFPGFDVISIHALLAESDGGFGAGSWPHGIFLSTLSLRRATHFDNYNLHCVEISIHALLAESDDKGRIRDAVNLTFLSTLSLRRAT